jgi:serine/threonine protein phosphatase PrpC
MTANAKVPAVEIAVRTDPGRDPEKQVNEDSSIHKETALGLLAVVCDGMGGHAGGKEASELAIKTIVEIIEAAPPATTAAVALKRAIEEANARIWSMPTAEAGYRPGSTVVAVLAHEGGAEVAHVGDSRVYLVHAGAVSQVTRDHSMVQEMVDRNLIRAEDAAKHPDANKILRALGIAKEVEVDLRSEAIAYVTGDTFVLCSDGLSDLVEPAEILDLAGSHPPKQAVGQLVDLANARGGHDNITAMVVRMKTSAASEANDRGRVAKTIPLTTAHAAPPDKSSGPTGTLVSGPMNTQPSPAAPIGTSGAPGAGASPAAPAPAAILSAPRSSSHSLSPRPRTPVVVLGIILAIVAVAIVAAVVFVANRKQHRVVVPLVEDRRDASASKNDDNDGGGAETNVAPAPTLTADPSSRQRWRLPDGGAPEPCGAARRLRDRGDASAAWIEKLEERCRASGGNPR